MTVRRPRVDRPDPATVAERVGSCLPMARSLAKSARLAPGFSRADAYSAAYLGLTRAANGFDPALGFAFTTYAHRAIRSSIADDLRSCRRANRRASAAPADRPDPSPGPAELTEAREHGERQRGLAVALMARLGERDRGILARRFGLDGEGGRTLAELGHEWGLTKQGANMRVRDAISRAVGQSRLAR